MSSADAETADGPGATTPRRAPWWLAPAVVAVVVGLDQLTKYWAERTLEVGHPQPVIGELLEWRLSYNTGSAFSLIQGFTPLLAILAAVVAVVLVRVVLRARDVVLVLALSLVLGGAIGNLIDRVTRGDGFLDGGVVDFIGVGRFPTFNIADSAITIGAFVLIIWAWRRPEESKADESDAVDEDAVDQDASDEPAE